MMRKPSFLALIATGCLLAASAQYAHAAEGAGSVSQLESQPAPLLYENSPTDGQPDMPASPQSSMQSSQEPAAAPQQIQQALPAREKTFSEKFAEQRKIWWQNLKRWADVTPDSSRAP